MKRSRCPVIEKVLRFLEAAFMGCLFACFRIKDDDDRRKARLSTNSIPVKNRVRESLLFGLRDCLFLDESIIWSISILWIIQDPLVSKNQLDSVSLFEGKDLILESNEYGFVQKDNCLLISGIRTESVFSFCFSYKFSKREVLHVGKHCVHVYKKILIKTAQAGILNMRCVW